MNEKKLVLLIIMASFLNREVWIRHKNSQDFTDKKLQFHLILKSQKLQNEFVLELKIIKFGKNWFEIEICQTC